MATSSDEMTKLSWRRFEDGDNVWDDLTEKIFVQDTSHKCPTYVHKTPPARAAARPVRTSAAGCRSCAAWNSRRRA